jgi:hypothetical protein
MTKKDKKPIDPEKIQSKANKLQMRAYFECSKGNNEEGLKCKFKAENREELLKTYSRLVEGRLENNTWPFRLKYFLRNIQLYRKGIIKKPNKYL